MENNAFQFPTVWPGWCQQREKPLSPIATNIMPKKQVWRHRMVSRRLTFDKPSSPAWKHCSVSHCSLWNWRIELCRTFSSGWWLSHPSEKYELVSWDHYPPIYGKKNMFQTTNKSCKRNGICIGWFKNMTQENHGKSTNEHEWTITCKVSGKTFNVHHRSSWTTNSANLAPKTESETMFGPQKLTSEICCAESRGSHGCLFLLKKHDPISLLVTKDALLLLRAMTIQRSSQLAFHGLS